MQEERIRVQEELVML